MRGTRAFTRRSAFGGAVVVVLAAWSGEARAQDAVFVYGPGQPAQSFTASGDQALVDRLTALGYTVQTFDDSDPGMVAAALAADLLFVSETVASGDVVGTFAAQGQPLRDLPVPLMTSEPYLFDDLALTGPDSTRTTPDPGNGGIDNGDWGNAPPHHSIDVVDAGHPLAAGLPAGVFPLTADGDPVELAFGVPNANAQVIARLDPATPWNQDQAPDPPLGQRACYFVYEPGAVLVDGLPAPARRVALPFRHGAPAAFTEAGGWELFEAAASYTSGVKVIQGGGAWSDPLAWSPQGLPDAGHHVYAQGPGAVSMDVAAPSVRRLTVVGGASLEVAAGVLAVAEAVEVEGGAVEVRGSGTLRALGELTVRPAGRLELSGDGTVSLAGQPCRIEGELRSAGGRLVGDGTARMDVLVTTGTLHLDGLLVRQGDGEGLHVQEQATIARLRGVAFDALAPDPRARFLTIEAASLDLSAPGCTFGAVAGGQHNVRLVDADGGGDVVLNLERRATSGAGAGPAAEEEVGGAAINWVHACPDTTAGRALGTPQVAWDLNTFAEYAMYAAFADVDGAGTDRIHVFDPSGDGVEASYHFDVPQAQGDVVGYPWWDQLPGTGRRVVWVVTDAGRVLRFTDPGYPSGATGAVAPDAGFPRVIQDAGQTVTFTSPPLTDSADYLYVAALRGSAPRLVFLDLATGALAASVPLPEAVSGELAAENQDGVWQLFAATAGAGGGGAPLIDEDFADGTSGGFTYRDDAFRGTNNPSDAAGGLFGQSLLVALGANGTNMSGGWARTFVVSGSPVEVEVEVTYRLYMDGSYEPNEHAEALVSVGGQLLAAPPNPDYLVRFTGDGNSGPDMDSGYLTATWSLPLADGAHELVVGGFSNQSTTSSEISYVIFDDIRVSPIHASGSIYRVDAQTQLIDAAHHPDASLVSLPGAPLGAPFGALGYGLFLSDASGTVHGVDQSDMSLLPGWPVQPSTTPVQGSVWLDWATGQVFWGDEAGVVFGYDLAGSPLAPFPLTPAGGAPIRGGGLVDAGLLWVGDVEGRLVGVDVSSGGVVSPDYRFGAGVDVGPVAQELSAGRLLTSTSAGKLLVVAPVADPTP